MRQALLESLVLAGLALARSTLASIWMVRMLVALAPATVPRLSDVGYRRRDADRLGRPGPRLSAWPWPSCRRGWQRTRCARRSAGRVTRRGGASRAGTRLRTTLVVAEVALAVVITIQAGLLFRSFAALLATDPGFMSGIC